MSGEVIVSKVAGFLQLDATLLDGIDNTVLNSISEKLEELRREKSENVKISASLDQMKSQSEMKIESLKSHISQLIKDIEDNKNERISFEEDRRRLIEEKAIFSKKIIELEQNVQKERQQKELTAASNHDLVKSVGEKNDEIRSLEYKLNELQSTNKQLRQEVLDTDAELQALKSKELREKSELSRLEQEKKLLQDNNDWLTTELNAKNAQFNEYRENTSVKIQESASKISQLQSELDSSKSNNESLNQTLNQLQTQLHEKLSENKKIKDDYNFNEQEFEKELSLKQKMIDVLEKHVESLKKEMESTKKTIQSSSFSDKDRDDLLEEIEDLKKRVEASELKCVKLNESIEELTSNTAIEDPNISNTVNSETSVSAIPKLYGDIGMLKKQLIVERRQKEELKSQVQAFVIELEHKVPILNSFKERTEMLENELNEVTILLETTGKDRDNKASQLEHLKATINSYESQISSLSKQRIDLARQIQFLLVNQSIKTSSDGPLTADELKFVENLIKSEDTTSVSDTQSVITDRLVKFSSIAELQEKNAELLSTIRNLADELERKEAESKAQSQLLEDDTVREAKETIFALHDHAQNLEQQLSVLTKERDAYKALASNSNSDSTVTKSITYQTTDLDTKAKELETRITAVIQEAENNANEWSNENNELKKRLYEVSLQFESEKTSRVLAEDRLSLLQSTLELSKKQCEELKKRSDDLQKILTKQDKRTQETVEVLISTKTELSSLQSELTILKSEKTFLEKVQKDLKKENERLSKESVEYKVLIAQLQALQRERDALLKETQESFQEKLRKLENELTSTSERLTEKEKVIEENSNSKQQEYKWFQEKIDELNNDVNKFRNLANEKDIEIQSIQSKTREQAAKLKEFEAKIQSYDMLNNIDDTQNLVETLRQELEKTNLQLSDAYSQMEHFKNSAEKSAESVNEISATFEKAQQESQNVIISLESDKKNLQNTVNILNDQITDLNNEISHQRDQYQTERQSLLEQLDQLQSVKNSVDDMKSKYKQEIEMIQKDLRMQTQYANDAQKSYEQELQKHADVSKTITSLRTEAQHSREELENIRNQFLTASETLKNNEELIEKQRSEYEGRISELQQKVQELSSQNTLLYDQLELLNKSETNENVVDSNDLLISLRRERDVLQTKLEIALSEQNVLRQRLDLSKADVQNLNSELSYLKSSTEESVKILEQHESIMKELDQLNLLRESNITLRSENSELKNECTDLNSKIKQLEEKISPLESSISALQTSINLKEQELNLAKEEADRWKKRSQDILHKYERIDPEEHGKLKDEINIVKEDLKKTKESLHIVTTEKDDWESKFQRLKTQARDKLTAAREKEQSLTSEINEMKQSKAKIEEQLQQSSATISELKEKLNLISEEKDAKEKAFDSQLAKLQEDLLAVQKQMESTAVSSEQNVDAEKEIESLSITIKDLNKKIQQLETDLASAQEQLVNGRPAVISEDTSQVVEKLKKEFEAEKEQLLRDKERELTSLFEAQKEEAWKVREEQLKKEFEQRAEALKEESQKNSVEAGASNNKETAIDIDALKTDWEKEYETQTLERIKSAEEALKKRIRLPTQQKIDKIVEARRAVLEESFEERVREKAQEMIANGGVDSVSLEQHRAELEELKSNLRKQFEEDLAEIKQKSFEEGKQQVSLKLKFLESKIKNLEKDKRQHDTVEATPDPSNNFQHATFGTQQNVTNPFSMTANASKRMVDEPSSEQPVKRQKEDSMGSSSENADK